MNSQLGILYFLMKSSFLVRKMCKAEKRNSETHRFPIENNSKWIKSHATKLSILKILITSSCFYSPPRFERVCLFVCLFIHKNDVWTWFFSIGYNRRGPYGGELTTHACV